MWIPDKKLMSLRMSLAVISLISPPYPYTFPFPLIPYPSRRLPLQNCYKLFPSYCANWRFLLALLFVLTYRLDACQHVIKIARHPAATAVAACLPSSLVLPPTCCRPFLECIYWINQNVKCVCEHQSGGELQGLKIVAIMVYKSEAHTHSAHSHSHTQPAADAFDNRKCYASLTPSRSSCRPRTK